MVGLGLEGSDADEPGGAELCSFAPCEVSMLPDEGFISPIGLASLAAPDAGGAELCSLAPPPPRRKLLNPQVLERPEDPFR